MLLKWILFWASFAYAIDNYVVCTGNFNANLQLSEFVNRKGVFCKYVFKNGRLVKKNCRNISLDDGFPYNEFNRRKKRSSPYTNQVCCLSNGSNQKCGASVCNTRTQTKIVKKYEMSFSTTEISTLCKSSSLSTFPPPFHQKLTRFFGKSPDLPSLQKRFCRKLRKLTQSAEDSKTVTKTSLVKCKKYLLNSYKKYYSNPDYQKCKCKCSQNNAHRKSVNHYMQLLLNSVKQEGKEEQLVCYYFNNGKYPDSYQLIAHELDKSRYWDNSNSYLNQLCSKRKHRPGFHRRTRVDNVRPNIELYAICHYAQTGRYFNDQPVAEIVRSRLWNKPDTFFGSKCGVKRPYRPLEFWFGEEDEFSASLRPKLPSHRLKNSRKVNGYWVVNPTDWAKINDYVYSGKYFKQRHTLKRANLPFGNPILNRCKKYLVNRYQKFQSTANKPCCNCHKKTKTYTKVPKHAATAKLHPSQRTYSKKSYSKSDGLKRKVVQSSPKPSVSYSKTNSSSSSKSFSATSKTSARTYGPGYHKGYSTRRRTRRTSHPSHPTHEPHSDVYLSVKLNKGLSTKLQELKRQLESLTHLVKGQSGEFSNLARTVLNLFKSIERPNELFKIKFSQNIQRSNSWNYDQLKSLVHGLQASLVEQLNNAASKVVATMQQVIGLLHAKLDKKPKQQRISPLDYALEQQRISSETTCPTEGFLSK